MNTLLNFANNAFTNYCLERKQQMKTNSLSDSYWVPVANGLLSQRLRNEKIVNFDYVLCAQNALR